MRRAVGSVVLAIVLLASLGCAPVIGTADPPIRYGVMTTDAGLHYVFSGTPSSVTASAGAQFGDPNVREIFWRGDAPWSRDQQVCVTWDDSGSDTVAEPVQPGIALRIAPTGPNGKGFKAVTVTRNVVYGAAWIFNVHVWDTTKPNQVYRQINGFDLSSIVGKIWVDNLGVVHRTLAKPPWHVCALAIGTQFWFKVWTAGHAEPSWQDSRHVFRTNLPKAWDYVGYAGGYIGHLRAGDSVSFDNATYADPCTEAELRSTYACLSEADRHLG